MDNFECMKDSNLELPSSSKEEEEFKEVRTPHSIDMEPAQSSNGALSDSALTSDVEAGPKQSEVAPLPELVPAEEVMEVKGHPGYIRFSRDEKKMFRKCKRKGFSDEEARDWVRESRENESMPEIQAKRKKVEGQVTAQAQEGPGLIENSRADPGARLGILTLDYPVTLLSKEQVESIKAELLEKVLLQVDSDMKPKFKGFSQRHGLCVVDCANRETAEWVISVVKDLKPLEGVNLKVVEKKDIPKAQVVVADFPNSKDDSNERILQFVTAQNVGINTESWKVLSRSEKEAVSELTILVDTVSKKKLTELQLWVNFKFGSATFRLEHELRGERAKEGTGQVQPNGDVGLMSSEAVGPVPLSNPITWFQRPPGGAWQDVEYAPVGWKTETRGLSAARGRKLARSANRGRGYRNLYLNY